MASLGFKVAPRVAVIALIVTCGIGIAAETSPNYDEPEAHGTEMAARVQEELARGQRYDGEKYDRLMTLGPEAVPELCKHLETYEFPLVIVEVVALSGEKRAVAPLITFLKTRRAEWRSEAYDVLTSHIIDALKELNDTRAEGTLLEIAHLDGANRETRFKAFGALARLGSPPVRAAAWKEIWRIHTTEDGVSTNAWPHQNVILYHDVYLGLCEVQTKEADEALAAFISGGVDGHRLRPVLQLLGRRTETRDRQVIVEALLELAEKGNSTEEFFPRMDALATLHAINAGIPDERLRKIVTLLEESFPHYTANRDEYRAKTKSTNPFFEVKAALEDGVSIDADSGAPDASPMATVVPIDFETF